ncbi:LytR family transcriptional regulator [Georgenia thermotolerans]|uniref:LytR family transcriptional regulator n=1 Tax=Georgenia thermotolerans TaxID=527326 RepID=A0A7J5USK4_9MICO|nr:LytR family transcriptional regulator [Georgenia thermotolerans]
MRRQSIRGAQAPTAPPSYAPPGREASRPPRAASGRAAGPEGRPAADPRVTRRRRRHPVRALLVVLLVLAVAWPVGLLLWANGKIQHTEALSGAPDTPGTTYLLAGSDSRSDGSIPDGTEGQRADTIMVLHVPASGTASLISLPRDTLVQIPDHGANKLNAAFSLGGPPLLVRTVESLTGLTVDHYVQIGMGGVQHVVDAVGGVELCLDYDVSDPRSELEWTSGCHLADGRTALAFSRMRYGDPKGDIGRGERQRQVIGAVVKEVATPATLLNPADQVQLIDAGTNALVVDQDSGIIDLGRMALAFRSATGPDGIVGTPPIANTGYRPGGGLGSTVLLDENRTPGFFGRMRDGTLTKADVEAP